MACTCRPGTRSSTGNSTSASTASSWSSSMALTALFEDRTGDIFIGDGLIQHNAPRQVQPGTHGPAQSTPALREQVSSQKKGDRSSRPRSFPCKTCWHPSQRMLSARRKATAHGLHIPGSPARMGVTQRSLSDRSHGQIVPATSSPADSFIPLSYHPLACKVVGADSGHHD